MSFIHVDTLSGDNWEQVLHRLTHGYMLHGDTKSQLVTLLLVNSFFHVRLSDCCIHLFGEY